MANPANSTAYPLGDGRLAVDVTEAKTLTIVDSGYVQNVLGDITVTLPATATHGEWTIRNKGEVPSGAAAGAVAGGNTVTIAGNAADRIQGGPDGTAVEGDTFTTDELAAELTISNTGETNGPIVTRMKGAWTRVAA